MHVKHHVGVSHFLNLCTHIVVGFRVKQSKEGFCLIGMGNIVGMTGEQLRMSREVFYSCRRTPSGKLG